MSASSPEELFEHELEDIYYAEHELLDVLDELANQTESADVTQAFREHREQTQEHIDRVEQVFDIIGEPPEEEECEGILGLVREHQGFVDQGPDQRVLDAHNITAAEKTEHYEIAAYGNLAHLADRLDMDEAADLLGQNLDEEQETLDRLKTLSENHDFQADRGS